MAQARRALQLAVTAFILFAVLSIAVLHLAHRRTTADLHGVMTTLDDLVRVRLHVMGAQVAFLGVDAGDPTFERRRGQAELARAVQVLDDWLEGRSALLGIAAHPVEDPMVREVGALYRELLLELGRRLETDTGTGAVERRVLFAEVDRVASDLERVAWGGIREALSRDERNHALRLAGWGIFLLVGGWVLLVLRRSTVRALEGRMEAEGARKALEQRLRQAEKLEAVGQLTGGIAHDFNNLLTVILANVELLEEKAPADLRPGFRDVEEAARQGQALVSNLLGFSRRADLSLDVIPLAAPVESAVRLARRVIPADIRLDLVTPERPVQVRADATAVQQIVLNLLVNARDAMPQGGSITVELDRVQVDHRFAETHPGLQEGPHARVEVSDTGSGMDRETLSHIFEPFFTTKEEGVGTGLGLATVHGLVRQHGGTVEAYSEPGKGTTFRIHLPEALEAPGKGVGLRIAGRGPLPPVARAARPAVVLLVDDDDTLRRTARRVLERLGYRVREASGGAEALESLRRDGAVDLVLSDVAMEGMGGVELHRALASHPGGRPAFLFTSGYTARDVEARSGLPAGARFLPKPWSLDQLSAAVAGALDSGGSREADSA